MPHSPTWRARVILAALLVTAAQLAHGATAGAVTTSTALSTSRLAFDSNRTGTWQVFTENLDGSSSTQLTWDPAYDSWWPKISPDRTHVLFYRTPAGTHDTDFTQTSLWVMDSTGGGVRRLLAAGAYGWALQGHAEWSPDGAHLVMFAGSSSSPQIVVTAADGTNPRVVRHREGSNLDPSWSPDGSRLLFVGCPGQVCLDSQYEVFSLRTDGTDERQLTSDAVRDHDPYFSPDGATVAWLRQTPDRSWSIFAMHADGGSKRAVVSDGIITSKPAWSLDGSRLYFHRLDPGLLRVSYALYTARLDGSGLTRLGPAQQTSDEYPVASSR